MPLSENTSNVMIIEEDNMLSTSIKNMLKKMGFAEKRIHRVPNLATFKRLINKSAYHLIICRYSMRNKPLGRKFLHLYRQSTHFSYDCSFVYVIEKENEAVRRQIEDLLPDNILEIPFSYNQFKPMINEGLAKRKVLSFVYRHLDKGNDSKALDICRQVSHTQSPWRNDLYKVVFEYYFKHKQYQLALKTLNELRIHDQTEWPLIKQIQLYSLLGDNDKVVELANEFQMLGFPDHPILSEVSAHQSILESDTATALALIKKLVLQYPHMIGATINLAYLYIAQEDYQKAYTFLIKVNDDLILDERQYFCIEELKTFIEFILDHKRGKPYDSRALDLKLAALLSFEGKQIDRPVVTKKLYQCVQDINSDNPVCSMLSFTELYNNTRLAHRKLTLMLIAYQLGFIDKLNEWLEQEHARLSRIKHIDAAVRMTLCTKIQALNHEKRQHLQHAEKLKSDGWLLEPLAITCQQVPSVITHHLNFINAMVKYKVAMHNNTNLLYDQFKSSTAIIVANLQRQDPNHPKILSVNRARRMVLAKLEENKQRQEQKRDQSSAAEPEAMLS